MCDLPRIRSPGQQHSSCRNLHLDEHGRLFVLCEDKGKLGLAVTIQNITAIQEVVLCMGGETDLYLSDLCCAYCVYYRFVYSTWASHTQLLVICSAN